MTKFTISLLGLMFLVFSNAINAQSYYGAQAQEYIKNAKEIHLNKSQKIDYIEFNDNYHLSISNLKTWIGKQFQLTENVELVEINRFTDNLKQTHIRYKLSIDKAKVHDAMIIVHLNNDRVI